MVLGCRARHVAVGCGLHLLCKSLQYAHGLLLSHHRLTVGHRAETLNDHLQVNVIANLRNRCAHVHPDGVARTVGERIERSVLLAGAAEGKEDRGPCKTGQLVPDHDGSILVLARVDSPSTPAPAARPRA
jgi:hypothetical protein